MSSERGEVLSNENLCDFITKSASFLKMVYLRSQTCHIPNKAPENQLTVIYTRYLLNLLKNHKYPIKISWYSFKILTCLIPQCKTAMSSQGVLSEHFPMRTFTVLLLNLELCETFISYLSKIYSENCHSRIRNSYPVGLASGKLK